MKSFTAFIKKEITEQIRTGKLFLLLLIFLMLGIMNPAIAKLTPWLFEMLTDTLEGSGLIITEVTVTAMDSWVQFFKNLPIGLIAFILIESSIFTKEYSSGTLVLSLTKGLSRGKVVVSKAVVLMLLWSTGFWLCFGITYMYNTYFWDNSIAQNLILSALCWWVFGVLITALTVLFSVIFSSGSGVLAGIGLVVLFSYLAGLIPKIANYLPTHLTDGNSLIYATASAESYTSALIIAAVAALICFAASIPIFNKKTF